MLHPDTNALVGLIVIESAVADEAPTADAGSHDATLGQVLRWLARGERRTDEDEPAGPVGSPLAGSGGRSGVRSLATRLPGCKEPALVAADCPRLESELHRAWTQLRRRLATAGA